MSEQLYRVIKQTANGGWLDKKCFWCGEFFKPGDEISLVIIAFEYKKIYKRLSANVAMHKEEFDKLENECHGDHEKIVTTLGEHKQKRVSHELTDEQKNEAEAFKTACRQFNFCVETDTKDEIHMRVQGSSITITYNPRTKRMNMLDKIRKKGMFDEMYQRDIIAKAFNRMQEILGSDKRDNFSSSKIIEKAYNDADKMMGKN